VRTTRALAVLAIALLTNRLVADDSKIVGIEGDDLVVAGSVKIRPGVYRIADANGDGVIHVRGDGSKLDLTGVTLIGAADGVLPDAFTGIGVSVDGAKDVCMTGGAVRGFKIGVRAHDAPGIHLTSIDASGNFRQHLKSTVEREDESDWLFGHENDVPSEARRVEGAPSNSATNPDEKGRAGAHDEGHWERDYGAGIALKNCGGAIVDACVVRNGQNGVLLDRCDKAQVFGGDFSFNSGWGIALWRTCDALIAGNSANWCVRGYSHGRYARGQDSAGILVFEQCSRNRFLGNSATHGGDGFFLYAGNETLNRTGEGGCNDNIVANNDFSFAVANGIEATFSRGNRFRDNVIDGCEHGVWAGYSSDTVIEGNRIEGGVNGVSIEHGHGNRITRNTISAREPCVHLWWDEDADLTKTAYGRKNDLKSHGNTIDGNVFTHFRTDILLEDDQESGIRENDFLREPVIVRKGDTSGTVIETSARRVASASAPRQTPAWPTPTTDAFRSRKCILIDDWGPISPTETRLVLPLAAAFGAAKVFVVGSEGAFAVESLTDGFEAIPMHGELPSMIVVICKGESFTPKPFEIVVRVGNDVRRVHGTIATMPWDVRFFKWTADPRTDAEAWKTLLSSPPAETRRVNGLDFDWKSGAVSDAVGSDHFATLATCDVETAAGKWRIATVSDDGIRVWVDGALVLDDWTQHGPTPHDVDLDLAAGKHAIRVEHFEIDGWAALRVTLAPAN
jgi:parallel beta-helix repeat protein